VAVVNEAFAREAWPGLEAVGQRYLQQAGEEAPRAVEVVGVVADARYRFLSDPPRPFLFVPHAQQPVSEMTFFVRHAPGRAVDDDVRATLARVDGSVPVLFQQPFAEAAAVGLLPQRLAAAVAGTVGALGALLAALGLYGLMAFVVAQRGRELAVRIALGASPRRIRGLVLGQAAAVAGIGGVVGVGLAAAVGTLARSLLVGVTPVDPVSLGVTLVLLTAVLALACAGPLRRAMATDAAVALRAE
jgi:putative ABC transport system permease protein